jgi:hypothetical protein
MMGSFKQKQSPDMGPMTQKAVSAMLCDIMLYRNICVCMCRGGQP